jgi:5'(3')-deoxyribonucleotidase
MSDEKKKIVYIDMDGVLCNFEKKKYTVSNYLIKKYGAVERIPGFFTDLEPIPDALESVSKLDKYFDLHILSTASWINPSSLMEKMIWVKKYFGIEQSSPFYHKVIFSHEKYLLLGDYLIDDRTVRNATDFKGKFVHFGTEGFPNWKSVVEFLYLDNNIPFE